MPDTYWRLLKYRSMEVQKAPALSPGREARSVLDFSYFSLSPVFLLCILSSFSYLYNLSPFPLKKKSHTFHFSLIPQVCTDNTLVTRQTQTRDPRAGQWLRTWPSGQPKFNVRNFITLATAYGKISHLSETSIVSFPSFSRPSEG